ncbi:MAG TPA: hypothetical protein VMR62_06340 [Bryobacteraceae bacterium]|nr:hypothetical protein [Bryobacteraceae bacterium]
MFSIRQIEVNRVELAHSVKGAAGATWFRADSRFSGSSDADVWSSSGRVRHMLDAAR